MLPILGTYFTKKAIKPNIDVGQMHLDS